MALFDGSLSDSINSMRSTKYDLTVHLNSVSHRFSSCCIHFLYVSLSLLRTHGVAGPQALTDHGYVQIESFAKEVPLGAPGEGENEQARSSPSETFPPKGGALATFKMVLSRQPGIEAHVNQFSSVRVSLIAGACRQCCTVHAV